MHRQKYLDDLLCLNCAQMFNANINHEQQLRNDENVREKFSYKVHRFFQRVLDVKTGLRDEKRFSPLARLAKSLPVLPRVPRTKPKWGTSLPLMLSFMYLQLCSSNFGTSFNLFISTATFSIELGFTSGFTRLRWRFLWIDVLNLKVPRLWSVERCMKSTKKKGRRSSWHHRHSFEHFLSKQILIESKAIAFMTETCPNPS